MKTKLFIISIIAAAVAFPEDQVDISLNIPPGNVIFASGSDCLLPTPVLHTYIRICTHPSKNPAEVKTIDVYWKGCSNQKDTTALDHSIIESQLKPQVVLRQDGIYEITFPEELRGNP